MLLGNVLLTLSVTAHTYDLFAIGDRALERLVYNEDEAEENVKWYEEVKKKDKKTYYKLLKTYQC